MTAPPGRRFVTSAVMVAAALVSALSLSLAAGEDEGTIAGRVVNGTTGAEAPSGLEVLLVTLDEDGTVDTESTMTQPGGGFRFEGIPLEDGTPRGITANYEGVMYSSRLGPDSSSRSVDLLVYEATDSLEAVRVSGDVLLIRAADDDEGRLAAFEVVELLNEGDRTFIPDLDQPANMNFLRFSLPAEATDLEVSSDLAGGQMINIGPGFALTAPLPPGTAQVAYTYSLPYQGGELEFSRTFPLGADAFRLLMETGTGTVGESAMLTSTETSEVDGRSYVVSAAGGLEPGARLTVTIGDLRGPSLLDRVGDGFADTDNWGVAIPSAVGLVMAALLVYAMVRRPERAPAIVGGQAVAVTGTFGTEELAETAQLRHPARLALMQEMAALDDSFQRDDLLEEEYSARRDDLMARLLRLGLDPGDTGHEEA